MAHTLYYGAFAEIASYHIGYHQNVELPVHDLVTIILYTVPAVGAAFVSTTERMYTLGLVTLGSFFLTAFFYFEFGISVWCFFATTMSVVVVHIVRNENKPKKE